MAECPKQLTDLGSLVGKTIVAATDWPELIAIRFSDDSHVIFEARQLQYEGLELVVSEEQNSRIWVRLGYITEEQWQADYEEAIKQKAEWRAREDERQTTPRKVG